MKETLIKFIKQNELNFNTTGSGLNGACTIICGFADHVGANKKVVEEAINASIGSKLDYKSKAELNRVYDFASTYSYGRWWTTEEAKKTYKF